MEIRIVCRVTIVKSAIANIGVTLTRYVAMACVNPSVKIQSLPVSAIAVKPLNAADAFNVAWVFAKPIIWTSIQEIRCIPALEAVLEIVKKARSIVIQLTSVRESYYIRVGSVWVRKRTSSVMTSVRHVRLLFGYCWQCNGRRMIFQGFVIHKSCP